MLMRQQVPSTVGHLTIYATFIEFFKGAYDDPDKRATAEEKLQKLKQGTKPAFAYYA